MKFNLLILSLAIFLAQSQVPSGFNMALLPVAWTGMSQAYLPYLLCQSTKVVLPDFQFMGYTFSQGQFQSITLNPTDTSVMLNDGWISVSAKNLAFVMTAMAAQQTGEDQTIGAQNVTISTTNAIMTFGMIPFNDNGRLQFKIDNVTTDVGGIQVNAQQGFLSKVNNKLTSNPALKQSINSQLAAFVKTQLLMTLNKFAAVDNLQMQIPNTMLMEDISLVQDPIVTPQAVSMMFNETIWPVNNNGVFIPYAPGAMPYFDSAAQQEFQMFINDFIFNSALQNEWNAGLLTFTLPQDLQAKGVPVKDTMTDDLVQYFPDIVTKFGTGVKVKTVCTSIGGNAPMAKSTDSALEFMGTATCIMSNYDATLDIWNQFLSYTGDFTFAGLLSLENGNMLIFDANSASVKNMVVNQSSFDGVTADSLTTTINSQLASLIPMRREWDMPISQLVSLVNPVISYHSGYIEIVSNADFKALSC